MKSPFTDKQMKMVMEKDVLQFRKESFSFYRFAYKCEDTGELFADSVMQDLNLNQIYNQYREKYNIPFPEEIMKIRKKYGLSASKMSSILGFGTNSYRQYENGDIPSISNAKLIHLAKNPITFKQMVLDSSDITRKESSSICDKIDDLISKSHHDKLIHLKHYLLGNESPDRFSGYKVPDLDKFCEMVIFFSQQLNPLKPVLTSLLFCSDFQNYQKTAYSISGMRYLENDFGPAPHHFHSIFEILNDMNCINISCDSKNGYLGERFEVSQNKLFNENLFTEEEMQTLKQVACNFKSKKHDQYYLKNCDIETSNPSKSNIDYNRAFELIKLQESSDK